jgi:MraZ protein
MYYGESQTAIDEKGRITVPVQFRQVMDVHDHDTWYMTRGFDGAIFLFHTEQWNKLKDFGSGHHALDPRMLDFRRMFLGSAAKTKRDKVGRLAVPSLLREYAGLQKEAVLVGVEDHLELWSKERWCAFQQKQMESYKEMAASLFASTQAGNGTTEGAVRDVDH